MIKRHERPLSGDTDTHGEREMAPAIQRIIDDIVSCADEADGGKIDARRLCVKLTAAVRAEAKRQP